MLSGCATSGWNGTAATMPFPSSYGKGAASNFSTSIDDPDPFIKSSERLLIRGTLARATQQTVFRHHADFYFPEKTRWACRVTGFNDWASFGVRPEVFFLPSIFPWRLRAGLTTPKVLPRRKNGNTQFSGWLRKFTIAPQNRCRPPILQPSGAAVVRDLRELVQRLPRVRGRNPIPGQN